MPIYIDPTEARQNTRIPGILVASAHELPGLETLTGADILITPHEEPIGPLKDIPPHRKILQRHVDDGLLIQRKSGNDLLSSVHDLPDIEWRMQEWSPNPWLMVTGLKQGNKGQVVVDGKSNSRWQWASVSGVLDAWQDRGGSVKHLRSDDDIVWWLNLREKKCQEWLVTPEKLIAQHKNWKSPSTGKVSRQALRRVQDSWYTTNRAFPVGIGQEMLKNLAVYIVETWQRPPSFANAIALATSDEVLKVPLWGKVSLEKVRGWYEVTESRTPVQTGAESGCWIYSLPYRKDAKRTVFIVGGQIIDVLNDRVYQVEVENLGDLDAPMTLDDGTIVLNHLEAANLQKSQQKRGKRANANRTGSSRNNRSKGDRKDDSGADLGSPF